MPEESTAATGDELTFQSARDLPPEVGVLLLTVGVLGLLLPGPIGTPALLAGGVVLWPGAFGKLADGFERRWPRVHHAGMRQISRFLRDLERRYPRRG
jgi:hypothetical protein